MSSADWTVLPLGDILSDAGVSSTDVFNNTLEKASKLLSFEKPASFGQHRLMLQYLDTLTALLLHSAPCDVRSHVRRVLSGVCQPYICVLFYSTAASSLAKELVSSLIKSLASLLGTLLLQDTAAVMMLPADERSVSLGAGIVSEAFVGVVTELCQQRSLESKVCDDDDGNIESGLGALNFATVLRTFLDRINLQKLDECTHLERVFSVLFESLLLLLQRCDDASLIVIIVSTLLPHFITAKHTQRAQTLWDFARSVWRSEVTVECSEKDLSLSILCTFHDVFICYDVASPFSVSFPAEVLESSPLVDLRDSAAFWEITRKGLADSDSLCRKRSMYLLHCVLLSVEREPAVEVSSEGGVFWWEEGNSKELQQVWGDLTLVLETMEEKQIHIVIPVKKRLRSVMEATRKCIQGRSLLHFSWLTVALSRVFDHFEAKSIIRWGVLECLSMPLANSPLLKREHWEFVFGPLLKVLNESFVFAREQDSTSGSCPEAARRLTSFLQEFITELPPSERELFLSHFLMSCEREKLGEVPLLFVSHSLSLLPRLPLLGGASALAAIRAIVVNCQLSHKPALRAAIQCFLLSTACRMIDVASVGLVDVMRLLGCFRANECLVFNSSAWKEGCVLLVTVCQSKAASSPTGPDGSPFSLFDYLQAAIAGYTRGAVDPSLPDVPQLARTLLMAVSAECSLPDNPQLLSSKERSLQNSLSQLLAPVMELVAGARNRVYLSPLAVRSCVELTVTLVELGGSCCSDGMEMVYSCLCPWLHEAMLFLQDEIFHSTKDEAGGLNVATLDHVLFHVNALKQLYDFTQRFNFPFPWDVGPSAVAARACHTLSHLCTTSSRVVEVSRPLLGSLSALKWVCSLSSSSSTHTAQSDHTLCHAVAKLPIGLQITKPVKPALETSLKEEEEEEVWASARMSMDWGALLAHCFDCYWQCTLHTLSCPYTPGTEVKGHSQFGPEVKGHSQLGSEVKGSEGVTLVGGSEGVTPVGGCEGVTLVGGSEAAAAALARACLDCLDLASHSHLPTIIQCLATLVPNLLRTEPDLIPSCAETVWPLVLEGREKHKSFMRSLKALLSLVYHPLLLLLPRQHNPTTEAITDMQEKFARRYHKAGEARVGVYNLLVEHVCGVWWSAIGDGCLETVLSSLTANSELLLLACVFGPVHKKNLRAVEEVEAFVESLGDSCSSNDLSFRNRNCDSDVRVGVLNFLMRLASRESSCKLLVIQDFLYQFVGQLLGKVAVLSAEKPRYYVNSLTHRTKLRLLQAVIVLLKWTGKTTAELVVKELLQALQCDNQLSIRYLMEWAVVLALRGYPDLLEPLFFKHLQYNAEQRMSRMCSFFTIALHTGLCLPTPAAKESYYQRVFPNVYQWASSHHFTVRLYSQYAVTRMWRDLRDQDLALLLGKFADLGEAGLAFFQLAGDLGRFQQKVEENVFFCKVRADLDVNIETIFHVLPQLCNVIDEELVGLEKWAGHWQEGAGPPPLDLCCTNQQLLEAVKLKLKLKSKKKCGSETKSIANQLSIEAESDGGFSSEDVQKKRTPWSSPAGVLTELFPLTSCPSLLLPRSPPQQQQQPGVGGDGGGGRLVLVASLVSKPANLGGLCRTCEIFKVSELVLSNAKLLEDKQFQALSVTADKWLTITEVKLQALRGYLLSMQAAGYTLLGAEQTAHSKLVTEFMFPRRTVLVLGNEREGIPVEIIHILNACVEIPQLGVIRSLNVHVSAALLIWEYTKQHLLCN